MFGRFQQPERPSETRRHEQATEVRSFVDQIQAIDKNARVIVPGDLNDFQFSGTADILDHILMSKSWANPQYDIVHTTAEFHVQDSDHDPQVVRPLIG